MKVRVLKVYRSKETGKVTYPGQVLEYTQTRAQELGKGGWVEALSEKVDNAGPGEPEKRQTGRKANK